MKLSLSGRIVEHPDAPCQDPVAFARLAQRCGYDDVNLRSRQLTAETSADDYARLSDALTEAGLGVSMINAAVPSAPAERPAFERLCQRAADLGCNLLRVGFGPDTIEAGRTACDIAAPCGVRLVMQMHTGAVNETFGMAADWTAEVDRPNFGVNAEPANHLMIGEAFTADNLRKLGDRLWIVSLQSLIVVPEPGEGASQLKLTSGRQICFKRVPIQDNPQIDVAAVAGALREVGYDGCINMLEPYPAGEDLEAFCRGYLEHLRAQIAG